MVAAVSGVVPEPQYASAAAQARPPLQSSEMGTGNGVPNKNQWKPKSRLVSSRYMPPSTPSTSTSNSSSISSSSSSSSSFSASRRFPSPSMSRNSNPSSNTPSTALKRSVSADRRHPTPPPAAARPLLPDLHTAKNRHIPEISSATRLLVTSTRSLSVSFQGEAFSLPFSKTKVTPTVTTVRKGTPDRGRNSTSSRTKLDGAADLVQNSKTPDHHHRWPARARLTAATPPPRNPDSALENTILVGSVNSARNLHWPSIENKRYSLDGQSILDLRNSKGNSITDRIPSDSDSVSSDSTTSVQDCSPNGLHRLAISARFLHDTNSRLRTLQDPSSPLSTSPGSKLIVPPKMKRFSNSSDSPFMSSTRPARPSSPGRLGSPVGSPHLRAQSPSRMKSSVSTICNSFLEPPSVLSFAVDVQRGRVGENRIVDAHMLRLLYNRHLQWRFVNARTEDVLLVQKHGAEKNLWNACVSISYLLDTVIKKRHRLHLVRQKLKLAYILRAQMRLLEDWTSIEKDQSSSLVGAIEALKASTLRLPVVGRAFVDIKSLKDAIGSAVDAMQATASCVCSLLSKVEEVNSLTTELLKVTAKERALLEQCTDFVSLLAAMQVRDISLRAHVIQRNRV